MGFLGQPVVIALISYLVIGIVLLVGIMAAFRSMRARDKARKREAVGLGSADKPPVRPSRRRVNDDFDLFASSSNNLEDDPLADLYSVRDDDDDEEVDLSSLLSNIGNVPVHTVVSEQVNVNLASGGTTQARELLSILRDESDGRLMVLAGDTAYRTLLDDPDVKQQFTALMKELSAIILKPDDRPEPAATKKAEVKPVVAATPVSPVDSAEDTEEELVGRDYVPGDLPDMTLPDNPDNYKVDRFGRVRVAKVDKAPELNIAQAIESYLQYKIGNEPKFQRRGIHIKPALNGGVRIEAEGKNYDFVDEIENAEIREFIQSAINEWQDRH